MGFVAGIYNPFVPSLCLEERQESSKGGQTQPAGDLAAPKLTRAS